MSTQTHPVGSNLLEARRGTPGGAPSVLRGVQKALASVVVSRAKAEGKSNEEKCTKRTHLIVPSLRQQHN